jgi:hypothetical protein
MAAMATWGGKRMVGRQLLMPLHEIGDLSALLGNG